MATNTYVALDYITVPTPTPSVTFNSISQAYTDLVIVVGNFGLNSAGSALRMKFNGSSASDYSDTFIVGTGTGSPASSRESNEPSIRVGGLAIGPATTNTDTLIINLQNYSNTTTYKTAIIRDSSPSNEVGAIVGMWRQTSAISSVTLVSYNGTHNILAGTTFALYGVAKEPQVSTAKATGGTITFAADGYTYHSFTSSGTFTPSVALTCQVLQVAGGGGAGANHGGGGGAGGLLYTSSSAFSATSYAVTVGAGGGAGTAGGGIGANGTNSSVNSLIAIGGGRGGDYSNNYQALDGGSGGGASATAPSTIGLGTSGQGNDGGGKNPNYGLTGGGGGGAGAVGQTQTAPLPGNGGIGLGTYSQWGSTTSTGQNVDGVYYYAGGGGGGGWNGSIPVGTIGYGGYGGGGNSGATIGSGSSNGTAGTANTGGGGGCGGGGSSSGGAGGSGVVIIRYASV